MSSPYTPAHLAEGAIKRSIARLADTYPFHAKVLEQLGLAASPPVGTIGISVSKDGVQLLHNPEFVLSLPTDQLVGVLLHEVHHVVLGHPTIDPADYPDDWAPNVSLEVSANEFVREPLPPGAMLLEQFLTLPPMESSAQRYRRLAKVKDRFELSAPVPGDVAGSAGKFGVVLDNHELWQGAGHSLEATQHALAEVVHQAAAEAGGMPEELLAATSGIGTAPGKALQSLRNDCLGKLDWKQLLRRYAGRVLQLRPVFHRPPRRFPDLIGIVPGQRRVSAKVSVVAIIDTSGSIGDQALEEIDGELHRLSRSHRVHVVECDCEVHCVYRYRDRLKNVEGRGGTDFRPALDPAFLRPLRPGLIIYFTDGYGPAPARQPPWPVIWCLVPDGKPPCSWGRVIQMEASGAEK